MQTLTGRSAAQRPGLRGRLPRGAVALGLAGLALFASQAPASAQMVERVVDGDTIIVAGVGRVRLIGVDTPETVDPRRPVQFFGREASAFARHLLEGKRVRLEFDQRRTDRYGRTLAYVWLPDGPMANAEIIRLGFGHAYTRFPFRYLEEFRRLEREARLAGHGLWGAEDSAPAADGAAEWDDNGNGRVSCAEARRHGIAPVRRDHPAYAWMSDPDGDGVVCGSGRAANPGARRGRREPLGRQRQRPRLLRRGSPPRHRAGPPRPSGVRVHERPGWRRRGLRSRRPQSRPRGSVPVASVQAAGRGPDQSSQAKPSTRANSRTLAVTRTRPRARAWPAMRMS